MTDAAYDAEVPERDPLCWRCRKARVRVVGTPCADCRVILLAEYHEKRRANGGRFLYVPDNWSPPIMNRALPTQKASRMCEECARDFEFIPGRGRPPMRCPECRGGGKSDNQKPSGPKPDSNPSKAVVRAPRVAVAPVREPPPPVVQHQENGNGEGLNVPALTQRVLHEITQLEDAIAVRMRLVRSLEQYSGSVSTRSGQGPSSGESNNG